MNVEWGKDKSVRVKVDAVRGGMLRSEGSCQLRAPRGIGDRF